eukprot:TRINITY_DN4649_c0_g2_i1.p1 TRINITY_DN4649_c0_g2~~TRINITY_DN4649_c0_g2_i1.p1  ORF type:complete len:289 (+),score=47.26 TRINITY_DN4649_c0_g2_i1:269-1135(+)
MHPSSLYLVDDNITLELSEASLLHNCRQRYKKDIVYTWTGSILISINPYKQLPIYTHETMEKYMRLPWQSLPPHVFATSQKAFSSMKNEFKNQSIVCSGESGAGKTEATKMILIYLTALSGQSGQSKVSEVEKQLLEANPILEAFGNAKTVRNNNSSRFGKFIQVFFDSHGRIQGASIQNYLLEKARVVYQAPEERNYHIFYQILAGLDSSEKDALCLTSHDDYFYVNQGNCPQIEGVDDKEEYQRTKHALSVIGIDQPEQKSVMSVLAGILLIGGITFKKVIRILLR